MNAKLGEPRLRQRFARAVGAVKAALWPTAAADTVTEEEIAAAAREFAPVVWLLGKVQSGKTSLIRVMTGCSTAEIGDGFRACTKTARIFDFPEEAPLVRFLDTRGLGEAGYDPAEDLAFSERQAHLVIVTMRALDAQQEAVVEVARLIRQTASRVADRRRADGPARGLPARCRATCSRTRSPLGTPLRCPMPA